MFTREPLWLPGRAIEDLPGRVAQMQSHLPCPRWSQCPCCSLTQTFPVPPVRFYLKPGLAGKVESPVIFLCPIWASHPG